MALLKRILLNVLFVSVLSGFSSATSSQIPFARAFSQAGVVEQEFVVKRSGPYAINLKYGFSIPSARKSAWQFAGGKEMGAPFNVEVTITPHSANKTKDLLNKTVIRSPKLSSWSSDGLYARLAEVDLSPGVYTLHLNIPNYSIPPDITLSAQVVVPYKGK
jgi:hypothetical protein